MSILRCWQKSDSVFTDASLRTILQSRVILQCRTLGRPSGGQLSFMDAQMPTVTVQYYSSSVPCLICGLHPNLFGLFILIFEALPIVQHSKSDTSSPTKYGSQFLKTFSCLLQSIFFSSHTL